ncbi:phosphodiester glycosidase family protein [Microvirga sp. W0021]|uniref:Phosphodiester glycosidase family protein n=1 Tax=Hohaiivirga grylli TaxID=3133970 RepID=A0ABV0BKT7_9HYPH
MIRFLRIPSFIALFSLTIPGHAQQISPCERISFESVRYVVCKANPKTDNIQLFWKDRNGTVYGSLAKLRKDVESAGQSLVFAMNAGMYEENLSPVGLYVEKKVELHKINLRKASGNFHLQPNGVFYINDGKAGIMESSRFASSHLKVDYATQSGPMLVINNKLHPRFLKDSTSRKTRNGVGLSQDGMAYFILSEQPTTFHEFARLFRDTYKCQNALFLDGSISTAYAASLGQTGNIFRAIGPIVGVTRKAN